MSEAKRLAGEKAIDYVEDGMVVGVGTGSTVAYFIDALGRIRDRIAANHKASFSWDPALVEAVLARCTEVDSGARNVDHILNGTLLPEIAEAVLARMAEGEAVQRVRVTAGRKGDFKYAIK